MQKVAPDTKIIDHKWYRLYWDCSNKADAQKEAARVRKLGYQARIITVPDIRGYFIYWHHNRWVK